MATPNMGLVLPTDHGSADTWDTILDAVFNRIDAHDHSPGNGVQIALSRIAFDADITAVDAGGVKHAIYNLKAIDFFPVPPASTVGFGGAFFVSDGTGGTVANELYYRTTGGALVQFTNGATMNSAFFVGGIAGDYSAVGAQESYDDASTAFVFQQEIGAAVRQYAKLRASDLRLYEFKVHGTAGVPNFSVGLKSPAALANNYDLIMPGALPAQTEGLSVDTGGNVTAASKHGTRTLQLGHTLFQNVNGAALTYTTGQDVIAAGVSMLVECAIPLKAGDRITAIRFTASDSSTGPTKFQGNFGPYGGAAAGSTAVSAGNGSLQTLAITSGLPVTIAAGTPLWINVANTTGTNNTRFRFAEIDYDRP